MIHLIDWVIKSQNNLDEIIEFQEKAKSLCYHIDYFTKFINKNLNKLNELEPKKYEKLNGIFY